MQIFDSELCTPEALPVVDEICRTMHGRYSPEMIIRVRKAHKVADFGHATQMRKSGERYIFHPLAVAFITIDLQLDGDSVVAAILHDVLEDTSVTAEELTAIFGEDVTAMVDGVSKLTHLKFKSRQEQQAANFQKMLLAMTSDIRVILIKLSDRLHNMRTLGAMPPEKRRRIARETLEIYAPIAYRFGITKINNELEDLGFKALYPARYRVINDAVQKARGNRKALVDKIAIQVQSHLDEKEIEATVSGREKHLYSLYRKMRVKQLSFKEVYDMFALRIVVNSIDDCYRVLGGVHSIYKPIEGLIKDYIAIPKSNGYQSLHSILISGQGTPIEVQIRTKEMDRFAEAGIAAHWVYKNGEDNASFVHINKVRDWLNSLVDIKNNASSTLEFYENVKLNLFPSEIYVFSPKGHIFQLPKNSTPLDFAYAVHSDIGNTCISAKVDRQFAPLQTPLISGQTVQIITASNGQPNPQWLNYVVTGKAQSAIRHYLRNKDQSEAIQFGQRLVERALSRYETSIDKISQQNIDQTVSHYKNENLDGLLQEVGLGHHVPSQIAMHLIQDSTLQQQEIPPLVIEGTKGTIISMSPCCLPIPGDNIQGFLTSGKGIDVHRVTCKQVRTYRHRPNDWVQVEWSDEHTKQFKSNILIELINEPGVLARATTQISSLSSNIEDLHFQNSGDRFVSISITLAVKDRIHLARIIRQLRIIPSIKSVKRDIA